MQLDWRQRWFAHLTWKGTALIALMCVLNAMRRASSELVHDPLSVWLGALARPTGTGLVVALLATLAVVATYNRTPSKPQFRYPLLALAALASTAIGTIVLFAFETGGTFEAEEFGGLAWYFTGAWPRYALVALLLTAVFEGGFPKVGFGFIVPLQAARSTAGGRPNRRC